MTVYVCEVCGAEYSKWQGKCNSCNSWNSLVEKQQIAKEVRASKQILGDNAELTNLGAVQASGKQARLQTGFVEMDGVLGGGFVDEQVVLLSGEPGVGKSTLLLQIIVNLSKAGKKTLYVSGEESASQVAGRAARLFPKKDYEDVQFLASPGVNSLVNKIEDIKPEFVVVDSIQTIYDESLSSLPGSLAQVKSCTSALVRAAKSAGFILVLVGHITKEGEIAGPKALEHLVDTILQFEGESEGQYRVLRALKNRFGSTGEVGLFLMAEAGLQDMKPEDSLFGGGAEDAVGAAKTLVLEGNRPIVVQVQALTNTTVFAYPKRVAEGVSIARLQLICAILDRFAGTRLGDKDVYVRTAGGYNLRNATSDLAVAAAIISSVNSKSIEGDTLYIGEVSLSGKVFTNSTVLSRLGSIEKMGISKIFSSSKPDKAGKGVKSVLLTLVRQLTDK
jgi:DNA repair protein RadA/Sms